MSEDRVLSAILGTKGYEYMAAYSHACDFFRVREKDGQKVTEVYIGDDKVARQYAKLVVSGLGLRPNVPGQEEPPIPTQKQLRLIHEEAIKLVLTYEEHADIKERQSDAEEEHLQEQNGFVGHDDSDAKMPYLVDATDDPNWIPAPLPRAYHKRFPTMMQVPWFHETSDTRHKEEGTSDTHKEDGEDGVADLLTPVETLVVSGERGDMESLQNKMMGCDANSRQQHPDSQQPRPAALAEAAALGELYLRAYHDGRPLFNHPKGWDTSARPLNQHDLPKESGDVVRLVEECVTQYLGRREVYDTNSHVELEDGDLSVYLSRLPGWLSEAAFRKMVLANLRLRLRARLEVLRDAINTEADKADSPSAAAPTTRRGTKRSAASS